MTFPGPIYRVPGILKHDSTQFMRDEKKAIIALNTVPGFRAILFHRALITFGSAAGILEAGRMGQFRIPGSGPAIVK